MSLVVQPPLNADDIMRYLPHRPPMLMLDTVENFTKSEIYATKNVPGNAHYFQGHFPDRPIMPGVMIVEAVAQAGALIAALNGSFDTEKSLLAFASIERTKFKRSVYPNETLRVYAKIVKQRSILYKFEGRAEVGDSIVAIVDFSATMVPKHS